MENSKKSAFPFWANQTQTEAETGLSKREYIATHLMQSLLVGVYQNKMNVNKEYQTILAAIARDAISAADELLNQLDK